MYIYINGEIIESNQAKISPFDHGFLYGLGLFETMRTYNGKLFLLHEHITRLQKSLKTVNILAWKYYSRDIQDICDKLLSANRLDEAYVRLNVSAGMGEIGLQATPYETPTTIMFMKPLPKTNHLEKEGVILNIPRNTPEGSFRMKSHHFLNNILAKQEVGADMSKEGIFFTKEGYLAEGVVSNIFFVKNEKIFTPSIDTGILDGITRDFIFTILDDISWEYKEGFYKKEELLSADEVFVTNSVQGIVPIGRIGDRIYKDRDITEMLIKRYERATRENAG